MRTHRRRQLKMSARSLVREAVWATMEHHQGEKPNILLFATRRGGSTWAMELIAANRGVRPLNQPFSALHPSASLAQIQALPRTYMGEITSVDDRTAVRLMELTDAFARGDLLFAAPTALWRREVDRVSNRLVLKITAAKAAMTWFDQNTQCDIVYLTRNPISQSLSCIRNGWNLTTEAYLRDPDFAQQHLGSDDGWVRDLAASGTLLEQWVLNWCLENIVPARALDDHPHWLHVRYEDCVQHPTQTIDLLADRLQLTDRTRMLKRVNRPSQSSNHSTDAARRDIEAGQCATSGWQADVDTEDMLSAQRIVDRLHLPAWVLKD